MLEISLDKVAYIIIRVRELDAKVAPWDEDGREDRDGEAILEDNPEDATRQEISEFIEGLNEDEHASIVALAWIGRGTYAAEELDEAIATAKAEHGSNACRYLLSLPLLADYLEDALDQLGYSVEDAESGILRSA